MCLTYSFSPFLHTCDTLKAKCAEEIYRQHLQKRACSIQHQHAFKNYRENRYVLFVLSSALRGKNNPEPLFQRPQQWNNLELSPGPSW